MKVKVVMTLHLRMRMILKDKKLRAMIIPADDECLIMDNSIDNNNVIAAATPQSQSSPAAKFSFSSSKSNQPILTSNGVRLWPPSGGKKLKFETWKHGGFKKKQKGFFRRTWSFVLIAI